MSEFANTSASEMAKSHADRSIERFLQKQDPVERTEGLIRSAYSIMEFGDLVMSVDESARETDVLNPAFALGIRVAIRALIDAGLSADQLPTEQLADRARMVSIRSSMMIEANVVAEGGDVRELYFEEDGGTARGLGG